MGDPPRRSDVFGAARERTRTGRFMNYLIKLRLCSTSRQRSPLVPCVCHNTWCSLFLSSPSRTQGLQGHRSVSCPAILGRLALARHSFAQPSSWPPPPPAPPSLVTPAHFARCLTSRVVVLTRPLVVRCGVQFTAPWPARRLCQARAWRGSGEGGRRRRRLGSRRRAHRSASWVRQKAEVPR